MKADSFRVTRLPGIYIGRCDGLLSVCVLGFGLHFKNTKKHRLYFSERNGLVKAWTVGRWRISKYRNPHI